MNAATECDVLMVGTGAAGSICSLRLAAAGLDVLMVGNQASSTALSTGRIDLTGVQRKSEISHLLTQLGKDYGLYQGGEQACRAVTNHGTVFRQSLCSRHDWVLKDLKDPVAVMGFRGNPDLEPLLICSAMAGAGTMARCRPYRSELSLPLSVEVPSPTLTDEVRTVIEALVPVIGELEEATVVIPPLFTGIGYSYGLSELERAAGIVVKEAATPLSNPGRRLQNCLENGAVREGCTLWKGRSVTSFQFSEGTAVEATIRSGLRELKVKPTAVVLATGNLVGGGLIADGGEVIDPLYGFATSYAECPGTRSSELARMLSTGLSNKNGQAVLKDGTLTTNVFVAGSATPGLSYPLGKGLGHSISDGWYKAELVKEAL